MSTISRVPCGTENDIAWDRPGPRLLGLLQYLAIVVRRRAGDVSIIENAQVYELIFAWIFIHRDKKATNGRRTEKALGALSVVPHSEYRSPSGFDSSSNSASAGRSRIVVWFGCILHQGALRNLSVRQAVELSENSSRGGACVSFRGDRSTARLSGGNIQVLP